MLYADKKKVIVVRPIGLIGAPSSAGAYAPGQEKAPRALRDAGLLDLCSRAGIEVRDLGDLPVRRWRPDHDNPFSQNLTVVVETATEVAQRVRSALHSGMVALVLGGDCTVGLGTVAGHLPTEERIGLLYFDIHADLNTPQSVPDGALDWMGVAHMLGEEDAIAELSRLGPRYPLLAPEQMLLFAHDPAHSTDWELDVIRHRAVATIPVEDVAANPMEAAARALAYMQARCDRLLIHFDVDAIDFTDAPLSENTGRNYGLTLDTAFRALTALLASDRLSALSITELNPDHGAEDGSTLTDFVERLVRALATTLMPR
jgi:arginase